MFWKRPSARRWRGRWPVPDMEAIRARYERAKLYYSFYGYGCQSVLEDIPVLQAHIGELVAALGPFGEVGGHGYHRDEMRVCLVDATGVPVAGPFSSVGWEAFRRAAELVPAEAGGEKGKDE